MSADFIHALPKAELHLHLEGTVAPATLSALSRRHPTPLPTAHNRYQPDPRSGEPLSEDDCVRLYAYRDFTGFLMAFKAVTERMRDADDYELVATEMARALHAQNVRHAEVFLSVGVVHWRGQEFEPLFAGLERARIRAQKEFGLTLLWIFDAVRNFGREEAGKVVQLAGTMRARQLKDSGESSIVGFGIGGDERRGPARDFHEVYAEAKGLGLRLTCHAGETAGPESIWSALNIGAERIGHGLSAAQDPELVAVLARRQVPVEVCISSNVATGAIATLEEHPVRKLFDNGVMVTLNTDDPAMFHTTLDREYRLARDVFGFTDEQLRELARNSVEASFLPAEKRLDALKEVDALA